MLVLSVYAPSTNFKAIEVGSAIFAVMAGDHRSGDKMDTLDKISTLTEWRSCSYYRDEGGWGRKRWKGSTEGLKRG